jgi:hypothetical protein
MIDVNLPTIKVRILSDWTFDEDGSPRCGTSALTPERSGFLSPQTTR